jgi:hypothetical protein
VTDTSERDQKQNINQAFVFVQASFNTFDIYRYKVMVPTQRNAGVFDVMADSDGREAFRRPLCMHFAVFNCSKLRGIYTGLALSKCGFHWQSSAG